MNDNELVWYLTGEDTIEGDEARDYLKKIMHKYEALISEIDSKLVECLKLNVKEYDGSIDYCVTETGERLSLIEIILEELLKDIRSALDEDNLL